MFSILTNLWFINDAIKFENLVCYKVYVSKSIFRLFFSGSISKIKCALTSVLTKALAKDIIPRKHILLSSNAPKPPPTSLLADAFFIQSISEMSMKRLLKKKSSRSEPLCIFATLELIAKQFGYYKTEEINALGKRIVKNSKKFLNKSSSKKSKKYEHKKAAVVTSGVKQVKKINKLFVTFAISVLLLAILLEYISSIPEIRSRYFYQQGIF